MILCNMYIAVYPSIAHSCNMNILCMTACRLQIIFASFLLSAACAFKEWMMNRLTDVYKLVFIS